jgi:flagella basal body P-ring formation protein FlgA
MRKILTLWFLVTVLAATPGSSRAATPVTTEPVTLRQSVVVADTVVRLGDLFTNAGDKAGAIIAYAPKPGRRTVFDAHWLYRVARAYGLAWRPLSVKEQTTVARDSIAIDRDEIGEHILAALVERGAEPDMVVALSNSLLRIHVPGDSSATIAVEDATYDARSRRFTAILVAPAGDPAAQRIRVTGRLHQITEIPVPARLIGKGTVITKSDIRWMKVRSRLLQRNIVRDAADLIGKAPRRGLRAGVPVRATDVRSPVLVSKGSLVVMVLGTPHMRLTARGRALEDGSGGQTIRIANMQSHKVIAAEVTGSGTVVVRSADALAMN